MRFPSGCFLLGALISLASEIAMACSCAGERPACQAVGEASAIFLGKTVSREGRVSGADDHPFVQQQFSFEVLEAFRGDVHGKALVQTGNGGGDCGYLFAENAVYLVYAYETKNGILSTNICMRTAPVDRATEDLAFLRSLKAKGPEGRIYGYVTTTRLLRWEKYEGQDAIVGAPVRLESGQGKLEIKTNERGEYEFAGLPPGNYRLSVDMPRKLGGGETRAVVLAEQACAYLPIIGTERGSISGVVQDATGQPVKHVWVELLRASDGRPTGIQSAFTGEKGEYRIEKVPAGAYLVGVNVTDPPRGNKYLFHPYQRSYYPGTPSANGARAVTVASSQPVTGVDWALGLPLQPRTLRGKVLGPDDKPVFAAFVELKAEGYENNADLASTTPTGGFTLGGLVEIRYEVQASSRSTGSKKEEWHCHRTPAPNGAEPFVIRLDRPGKDCEECRKK